MTTGEWFNDVESADALPGRAYYPNLYSCDTCGVVSVTHAVWVTCPVCALLEKLGLQRMAERKRRKRG